MAAVVTATVVLAFCIPLSLFVRSVAYDRAIDGAELEARSLAAELLTVSDRATVERLTRLANGAAGTPATIYLANGLVLGAPAGAPGTVPAAVRAGHTATIATPAGGRFVWEPVRGRSVSLAVMVSVPPGLLTRGVARELILLFGGGALLVLIAIVLADWMGRTIVRPISDLEDVTHRLRDGDMERRVVPAGPYEVAEVGRAVNELADRIDSLLASARMAGSDLGHRLRTPLTSLRLDIETLTDPATRASLASDLEALEIAVNRLIRETREPPRPPGRADLAGAIRNRMAFWAVLARSQGRHFAFEAPSRHIEVGLDKDDLEAAIDALISNIFGHTPEGTSFSVGLRQTAAGSGTWALVVEDDGVAAARVAGAAALAPAGVAEAAAAPSAPPLSSPTRGAGTGLGLDIVRRTAERAGGTLHISRSRNGGFRVELRLLEWIDVGTNGQSSRATRLPERPAPDERAQPPR